MAALDSDDVRSMLKTKMRCPEEKSDHYWYTLFDDDGKTILGRTHVSLGAKHVLGETLIHLMTRQLHFGTSGNFVKMVRCTLDREDCLAIIRSLSPPPKRKTEQK
jgi:hypothetical protein